MSEELMRIVAEMRSLGDNLLAEYVTAGPGICILEIADRIEAIAKAAGEPGWCPYCGGTRGHWEGCNAPISATPTTDSARPLAEAAGEPVAWRVDGHDTNHVFHTWFYYPPNGAEAVERHRKAGHAIMPLYAASPSAQPLVEALDGLAKEFVRVFPIYYYADPWAHDKNPCLLHAQGLVAKHRGQ